MVERQTPEREVGGSIGERGGSAVELRTPCERSGVRNLLPPCCVLEQDTLLTKYW